jgi:CheY-like chemotaxis protein
MDQVPPSPSVLVVEDEIFVRFVAVDACSDSGLCPYEAGDAAEALDVLKAHPEIRLVFTDINMPGEMSGLDLVRRVHEEQPQIELIVTSGQQHLLDCDLPDDGTFLPKPYQRSDLIALMRKKLGLLPRAA